MGADLVVIGSVTRPHSLHGEVRVRFFSDIPEYWASCGSFYCYREGQKTLLETESVREHQGCFLFRFKGVTDRTEAEALRGTDLYVPRSALIETKPGEYYLADLEGLVVVESETGTECGKVTDVFTTGSCTVLTVSFNQGGREVNVPFIDDAVTEVSIQEGRILVKGMFLSV